MRLDDIQPGDLSTDLARDFPDGSIESQGRALPERGLSASTVLHPDLGATETIQGARRVGNRDLGEREVKAGFVSRLGGVAGEGGGGRWSQARGHLGPERRVG